MQSELYKALNSIDVQNLNDEDKDELLRIFNICKNVLIRNHLALIFSDLSYTKAVPSILKKINERSSYNNNGTLVFSLENLATEKHFISFVKIICKQEYEARLMAYGILQKFNSTISNTNRKKALEILNTCKSDLEKTDGDKGENSTLHFVERSIELISNA